MGEIMGKFVQFGRYYVLLMFVWVWNTFFFLNNDHRDHPNDSKMPIRRTLFARSIRRTTVLIHRSHDDPEEPFVVVRRPIRLLTSGARIAIRISIRFPDGPLVHARLGRIESAAGGYFVFTLCDCASLVRSIAVPNDWVRLTLVESIRFREYIRTSGRFVVDPEIEEQEPVEDTQSESGVPVSQNSVEYGLRAVASLAILIPANRVFFPPPGVERRR